MKSIDAEVMVYLLAQIAAKTEEEGDCLLWKGAVDDRGPLLRYQGRVYALRRVMWMHQHGRSIPSGHVVACGCGNRRCVAHGAPTTRSALNAVSSSRPHPTRAAKKAAAARRNSRFPQELIERIRVDTRPWREVCAEHGISKSYLNYIKAGKFRRDYLDPFAGMRTQLGARA